MLKLKITVGSSYDPSTHSIFLPNDDANPFFIDTEYFTGRICIRVKDFQGVTPPGKKKLSLSPYFDGNNYQYSIQIQGRFKGNKWTADDILFGNDFDRKIDLPAISWLGLRIMKWVDPCLEADIYSDIPWAYSPLLFTINSARAIQDSNENNDLPPWPSPNGEHIKEDIIYDPNFGSPVSTDATSRKQYFSSKESRVNFKITENQVWDLDFFNSYIDFNKIAVKLPGLEIGILQYWDGQTRDSSVVFFVILFQLVEVNNEINEKNFIENNDKLMPEGIKMEKNALSTPITDKLRQNYQGNLTPKSTARWASVKSPSSKNHLTPSVAPPSESNIPSGDERTSEDDEFDYELSAVD
ncbi:27618_t:CDS:2 [Dentiscutata erythropus]|uniref:27618_t:CDS:1 n=1 Tax=Dentiscutata erythropus TaxID=1348616 RepID=A0A9N9FEZ9_9GLOM|nr:27618_t:CDS:2 [Dentiscutata erythropus]